MIKTVLLYLLIISTSALTPAAKRKKGEKNTPISPINQQEMKIRNELENFLSSAIGKSITKGGYISILRDNNIILEIGNKYNRNTLLPVASLSKSFTALAILKLQEENKLKITDRASSYLPELEDLEIFSEKITIKDLLNHHSGIPYEGDKSNFQFILENKNFLLPQIVVNPGQKYIYSNYNYRLLGKIIEIVAEIPAKEYISQHLLKPMNLSQVEFGDGYDCASGLFISPENLLRYAGVYLSGGKYRDESILAKKSFKKIFLRPNPNERRNYYGLGWHVLVSEREKKVESLFHSGIGDFNFGQLRIFPKNRYIFYFQTEHTGLNRNEFNKLNKNIEYALMKFVSLH